MSELTDRFVRQSDLVPRDRLSDQRVTIIGVGAIGRQVALQLASIGVPRLQLIDFDIVDATNVTTQGYRANEVGHAKVDALANEIHRIDQLIQCETIFDRYRPTQVIGQIVFCCVDSISARTTLCRSVHDR